MANDLQTQVQQFGKSLTAETNLKRMRNMIPAGAGVSAEQIASTVLAQVRQNPDLVTKCNPNSLMAACYDVAKSGLIPDGILGQAYIVPFKGEAQFIVGYRGLISLAMNSGQIQEIWAREVRQSDHFVVHEGTKHEIEHHVDYTRSLKDRGQIVAFYAVARFKHGGKAFEVMPVDEVDAIRSAAPGANSPAWRNHYAEMGKKTALRRLAKWLPQSVQKFTQMEEHFEATGQPAHLNDDMVIEAAPGSWQESSNAQPQAATQASQPAAVPNGSGNGQQAPEASQSSGQGQSSTKQGSRTAAAVGEGKRKPGRPKGSGKKQQAEQSQQPQEGEETQPAEPQQSAEEPAGSHDDPEPPAGPQADETPHDPNTGEVIEGQATEVPSTAGQNDEPSGADMTAPEMQMGRRGPLVDNWFESLIAKLNDACQNIADVDLLQQNCQDTLETLKASSEETYQEAVDLFEQTRQEFRDGKHNNSAPF